MTPLRFPLKARKSKNFLNITNNSKDVKMCLGPPQQQPTPEKQCLFKKWNNTEVTDHRIFWAMVKDPQLEYARSMNHGGKFVEEGTIKNCLAPKALSSLQQTILHEKEKIYASQRQKPLGTSPKINLPIHIDPYTTCLGKPVTIRDDIKNIVNPNIRTVDVIQQELIDRKHYFRSYKRLLPGEQAVRGYNDHFNRNKCFGILNSADRGGGHIREVMNWLTPASSTLIKQNCPQDDKNDLESGKTFGRNYEMGKRTVAEIMYGHTPRNILGLTAPGGKPVHEYKELGTQCTTLTERVRIVSALIRKQLREKKYRRGPEFTAVLCDLANGDEYVTESIARSVYETFEPPLDDELGEMVFEISRHTKKSENDNGQADQKVINWRMLAKILDYDRIQPWELSPNHECIGKIPCILQVSEGAEDVRLRIAKSIAARTKVLTTTNQTYQGDRGGLINGSLWRTLGVSNKKCETNEFSIHHHRRAGEDCFPWIQSSQCTPLMGLQGLCKKEMLTPRTKEEIEKILNDSGVTAALEKSCDMEKVWNLARSFDQMASLVKAEDTSLFTLESVRRALKQCSREAIEANVASLYRGCCSSTPLAGKKGLQI